MHTGKELEAHWVERGRLNCDSDAPQVGSARSDSARVVKVNRRKTNRRKSRPYCILVRYYKEKNATDPSVWSFSFTLNAGNIAQCKIRQNLCLTSTTPQRLHSSPICNSYITGRCPPQQTSPAARLIHKQTFNMHPWTASLAVTSTKHAVRRVYAVITNHSINSCGELHYRIKNSGVQCATNLRKKISTSRKRWFLA